MEGRLVSSSDRSRAENSYQSSSSIGSKKRDHKECSKVDSVENGSGVVVGSEGGQKRKRKSRWMGDVNDKALIPGMPTILPSGLGVAQQEAYIAQLQIEELSRKLRTGDFGISPFPGGNRSPSPEPFYGADGKRLNTREYRTRKKLEDERHRLIALLSKLNPEYRPPLDYRAPVVKIVGRVEIPQEEHPDINFVGLIIGPRGNTLKGLEKDTGAKIIIRGKGSVKEGKVGKAGYPLPGEDEPLHAYITSMTQESVQKACDKIKEIIRQGIEMPESQNALRKNQLIELARLNGTLREGEGPKCSNCGSTAHRTWTCPDKPNVTSSVICTGCGGAGHIVKDCLIKRPGAGGPPAFNYGEQEKMDEEYMSLMAELGEVAPNNNSTDSMYSHRSLSVAPHLFDKSSVPLAIGAPPEAQAVYDMTHGMTQEAYDAWHYQTFANYPMTPMIWPPLPVPPPPSPNVEPPPPGMSWPEEVKPPPPPSS